MTDKIEVQNVGQPGKTYRVDAAKYAEMRQAVLAVTPPEPPGLTPAEIIAAVISEVCIVVLECCV